MTSVSSHQCNIPSQAQVNDFGADALISQLLLLDSQSPNKVISLRRCHTIAPHRSWSCRRHIPSWLFLICCTSLVQCGCECVQDIKLFINSPGGSVTAGMGIYDAMQV